MYVRVGGGMLPLNLAFNKPFYFQVRTKRGNKRFEKEAGSQGRGASLRRLSQRAANPRAIEAEPATGVTFVKLEPCSRERRITRRAVLSLSNGHISLAV